MRLLILSLIAAAKLWSAADAAAVFCEDTCEIPLGRSCGAALEYYEFEGDCCSLQQDDAGECTLVVTTSCYYQVRGETGCTEYPDGTVGCVVPGTQLNSGSDDECPASDFLIPVATEAPTEYATAMVTPDDSAETEAPTVEDSFESSMEETLGGSTMEDILDSRMAGYGFVKEKSGNLRGSGNDKDMGESKTLTLSSTLKFEFEDGKGSEVGQADLEYLESTALDFLRELLRGDTTFHSILQGINLEGVTYEYLPSISDPKVLQLTFQTNILVDASSSTTIWQAAQVFGRADWNDYLRRYVRQPDSAFADMVKVKFRGVGKLSPSEANNN